MKLLKKELLIGRSPQCDLQITSDKKVSREHAKIVMDERGVSIHNLNPNNKTFVNQQEVNSLALVPGSEIQIGETQLFFQLEIYEPSPEQMQQSIHAASGGIPERNISSNSEEQEKKKRFYMIVGAVALLFVALMSMDNEEKVDNYEFRDAESIEEEITEVYKRKQDLEAEYYSSGKNSEQYIKAKANYMQGMREYRARNYTRAISYFRASLSFFPGDPLAERYLAQAQRKLEEEIQYYLGRANSLKEKAKYKQAMSHYRHVLTLINDKEDISYKEALVLYKECELRLKGDF
jgi:pSer/pThr/pTyr-binding forkhead associated (FHA) protein